MPQYKFSRILILLIICCIGYGGLSAQQLRFKRYSTEDGLPHNICYDLLQDKKGYIWIATDDGLVRFDGTSFKLYQEEQGFKTPYVIGLAEGDDGTIWATTWGQGLHHVRGDEVYAVSDLPAKGSDLIVMDNEILVQKGSQSIFMCQKNAQGGIACDPRAEIYRNFSSDRSIHLLVNRGIVLQNWVSFELFKRRNGEVIMYSSLGLFRYKGETEFESIYDESLFDTPVQSLFETPTGELWLGGENGIIYHIRKDQSVTQHNIANLDKAIIQLAITPSGKLFLVDEDRNSLYQYDFQRNRVMDVSEGLGLTTRITRKLGFMVADDGNLWMTTDGDGVYCIYDDAFTSYTTEQQLSNSFVHSIQEDKNGLIWVGTKEGLNTFDNVEWKHIPLPPMLGRDLSQEVIGLVADSNQNLYVVSQEALYELREQPKLSFIHRSRYYYMDPKDRLWLWDDVNVYARKFFKDYKEHTPWESLPSFEKWLEGFTILQNSPYIICDHTDQFGRVWLGTNMGAWVYDKGRIKHYSLVDGLNQTHIVDIQEDSQGNVWFAGPTGVCKFANGTFQAYSREEWDAGTKCQRIIVDDKEVVWVASDSGLYYFKGEQSIPCFNYTGEIEGAKRGFFQTANDFVVQNSVYYSSDGTTVWMGSAKGLYKYKENVPILYTTEDGLPDNFINQVVEDKRGSIWIGTENGLAEWREGKIIDHSQHFEGLDTRKFRVLLSDHRGALWIGTPKGLYYYDGKQVIPYNIHTGLIGEGINALHLDKEFRLWIGTNRGISFLDVQKQPIAERPPRVYIEKIILDDEETALLDYYELQTDSKLQVHFSAVSYANVQGLIYEYRLREGDEWQQTQNRFVNLRDLRDGSYLFQLRARKFNTDWSEVITLPFKISPPWWYRPWAIVIWAILFIGLVVLIATFVIRLILEREERKKQMEIRIAQSRLESLRSQMNPHFVFNAITAIQNFILRNNREEAIEYLGDFATLIRMMLNHSRKAVIPLKEVLHLLRLYIDLERMRFKDKFVCNIEVDEELDTEEIEIPSMLIQPYIENAIRHGLMHKESGGILTLKLYEEAESLICIIQDNGIGRKKAAEIAQWRPKGYESVGMTVTGERIDILSAIHQKDYKVKIIDLFDEEKGVLGTRVEIYMPLDSD